jgi:hypothetical protein
LFVRQDCDGSIALPASWIVDAAAEPIVGVRVSAQRQFQTVSAQPIDPIRHFGCTLRPAVAMKA